MKIPLYKPYISKNEENAVLRVLKSGKLSKGKEVELFEKEFAKYVGKKYAVAVNSGTSGLHLSVKVMNWKKGDEIITTPFTYIASSNALLFENLRPVFVDIDINTLNIDPDKIEDQITDKTKGMLLVDILGLPVDYDKLVKLKNKYNLPIIEDACEALGRSTSNFTVGKLADITVYGFHENKQLTTAGEGGMIVTDNIEIAKKCRAMRDQGRSLDENWMDNVILGYNFRLTEVQSAFGREQLKIIDKILKKRQLIAKRYSNGLKNLRSISIPIQKSFEMRSWFSYYIVCESSFVRDEICEALLSNGIASSKNYFPPVYNFPMYKSYKGNCKNTENISKTLLALPMYYEMNFKQVDKVIKIIKMAIEK